MSKADQMRANALHEVGEDYVWGAQGMGGVEGSDDYDCSGFIWRMYSNVGHHFGRTTADGIAHKTHHIPAPVHVGDMFVFEYSSGHAHHIGLYVGKGQIVEARSPALGVCLGTVTSANKRGAKWIARLADLGELTVANPTATVTARLASASIHAGASTTLAGRLASAKRIVHPQPVRIQYFDGRLWKNTTASPVFTNWLGEYTVVCKPPKTTTYRAFWNGTGTLPSSKSAPVKLIVRSS